MDTQRPAKACARTARGEGGQAVVEFAIVLPVLLLLVVGIFKFGTVYNNYLQLTNAVDSGARLFSVERGQASPCSDAAAQVITSAGGLAANSVTVTMTDSNPADAGQTYTYANGAGSGTCPTLASGDAATLSASYPCDLAILGVNFTAGLCKLSASATESVQ